MRALGEIISPVEPATFFSGYYGRNPLHIEATASDRFDKLLSLDDVDRLLSTMRFRTSDLFVKQAGRTIDVSSVTVRGDLIEMAKVYSLHAEGATLPAASCTFPAESCMTPQRSTQHHYTLHWVYFLLHGPIFFWKRLHSR